MTKTLWSLAVLLSATTLVLNAPGAVRAQKEHDHMKGHSHEDGHRHKEDEHKGSHKHGEHEGAPHEGHDKKNGKHAKHTFKQSHGGVVMELHDHYGELVTSDGMITLYMSNHNGHAIPAKGFSATVMVLGAQGRQGPITLNAAGGNRLKSTRPVETAPGSRIIVTVKDPEGHMSQARYQIK